MNADLRERIRQAIDARNEVCPSCGHWCRYLHPKTGFCQGCHLEHKRGGPTNPHPNLKV